MALSIAASEYFEGNDGFWSTFNVDIGPSTAFYQQVRLLPATSEAVVLVVLDGATGGCNASQCNCTETYCPPSGRGGVFNTSLGNGLGWNRQYHTAPNMPYFEIPFLSEQALNYNGTCEAGFDLLQLSWSGKNAPGGMLANQVVAPFEDTQPCWLGLLGINGGVSHMFNASSEENGLLQSLKNGNNIHNLYWAYTAGAYYRNPQVFGSLTFGGYDAARVDMASSITTNFSKVPNRDLLVNVTNIQVAGHSTLVFQGTPLQMMIDSVVTDIWLPKEACRVFEDALGLVWNNSSNMYLINDTQHANLMAMQPNVSFTLASGVSSRSVVITLPYAAFDLSANFPLANLTEITDPGLKYFPLKQATQPNQYYLGRTFLQEAYVTADYCRKIFTVGPAIPPLGSNTNIKAVPPPNASLGLKVGTIVGIAIGGAVAIALVVGILVWRRRSRSKKQRIRNSRSMSFGNTTIATSCDLADQDTVEYYKAISPEPMEDIDYFKAELDATATATGFVGQQTQRQELDANNVRPSLGHRPQGSFGSTGSVVSPLGEGRFISFGEPSPPMNSSESSSPPLSDPGHVFGRQLSAGSRHGLFEME